MSSSVQSFCLDGCNPFIAPFNTPLVSSCHGSQLVRIKGILQESGDRFDVNLQEGSEESVPVNLHVSVRAINNTIVLNSYGAGGWGVELTHYNYPLAKEGPSVIDIVCEMAAYQIYFNEEHFATYPYRRPLQEVTHVNVNGQVHLTQIERHTPGGHKHC